MAMLHERKKEASKRRKVMRGGDLFSKSDAKDVCLQRKSPASAEDKNNPMKGRKEVRKAVKKSISSKRNLLTL